MPESPWKLNAHVHRAKRTDYVVYSQKTLDFQIATIRNGGRASIFVSVCICAEIRQASSKNRSSNPRPGHVSIGLLVAFFFELQFGDDSRRNGNMNKNELSGAAVLFALLLTSGCASDMARTDVPDICKPQPGERADVVPLPGQASDSERDTKIEHEKYFRKKSPRQIAGAPHLEGCALKRAS